MKFPFVRPEIPPVEQWAGLLDVAYEKAYFTNFGILEGRLSDALAARFAAQRTTVTMAANATCGLTAALLAHEVQGRVVIPNFTFPATLGAVLAARCEVVLCDIDPETCEMDPHALVQICRDFDIAAVMPVRSYGMVRDLTPLIDIARDHAIPVIVDAAAALGVGKVQSAADVTEVFSLHATKSLGIGEGGAIFACEALRPRLREALNFGLRPDRSFSYGLNGKMSEFQAAIGLAQMKHVDRLVAGRARMARDYAEILGSFPDIRLAREPGETPWTNFPIILPNDLDIETFERACLGSEYQVRRYYWPTLSEGFGESLVSGSSLEHSRDISARAMCLPLYASVTGAEMRDIRRILVTSLEAARRARSL